MCLPRPPNNWTDNCQIQRWQCAVKTVKNKWVIVAALTLKTTSKHSCVLWCVLFSELWKHMLPIESVTCCSQTGSHHIHFIYRHKQYIWENWLGLWRYESRSAWAAWKEESAEVIFMTGSRVRGQGSITCASCHWASWENSWMFVQLTYPVSLSHSPLSQQFVEHNMTNQWQHGTLYQDWRDVDWHSIRSLESDTVSICSISLNLISLLHQFKCRISGQWKGTTIRNKTLTKTDITLHHHI